MLCEAAGFRTGSRWQEEEQQGAEKNSMKKRHLVTRGLAAAMAAVFLTAAAPVYAEDSTGTSGAGTTQSVQDSGGTPSGAMESAGTSSGIEDGSGSGTVVQSGSTGAESGSVSVTPDASEPSAAPQADAAGADDPVKSSSSAQEETPEVSEEAEQEKELPHMDVLYSAHVQNIGWMGWAKNGETAGTTGQSLRLEAIQIRILPNTEAAPANDGSTSVPAYDASVSIQAHVQNIGWMGWASGTAGTTGRSLRMEAVRIGLNGGSVSGGIEYRTHIQNIGWESGWAANGSTSGTEGRSLRLEAFQLRLTGDIANYYDVYYRAHIQNYGWLGWTCNGQSAGSSGCSYRMEALQVQLRIKGSGAPGSTANAFVKDQIRLNVPCVMQFPELPTGCESVALTNLLLYHGFRLGKTTIADNYLPYGSNYAVSFVGNPHSVNGAGVYPPGIVIAANRYLAAKGSSLRAYDITGSSMEQLYSYLDQGYPVLVWSTTGMASPYVTGHQSYGGRTYPWFSQEHCVVLKGYNRRTNTVYVSDSISGDLGRNASRFTDLYNQIGRFAAVIR